MTFEIRMAYTELEEIRALFNEYTTALGIDLGFQHYTDELANLQGKYAPPRGRLYIAVYKGALAGCIALRPFDEKRCEMKRLYVRPQYRNFKIGQALVKKIIADAREMQYEHMLLDTLTSLKEAIGLYRKLGYYEIEAYYHNPYKDVLYLQLDLHAADAESSEV